MILKKGKIKEKTNNFFDKIVTLYIFSAIVGLIGYMISVLFSNFYELYTNIFIEKPEISENTNDSFDDLQHDLLHNMAFTIVLVKAYNILKEYVKYKHINIKYILEIAIIAPVVEIIFNYKSYDFNMVIFYGVFATIISIIYLYFYDRLKKTEDDYRAQHN